MKQKKLAYEFRIAELKFEIQADNSSGLHVQNLPEGKVLCDDYDTVATWLGVFDGNTLACSTRICRRLNGKFELECYRELLDFIKEDELAMQVTRLVVRKKYRGSRAILMLFKLLFQIFWENGGYLFATSVFPNPGKLYVNKFGLTRHEAPFPHYLNDQQEAYLVDLNGYDRPKLREKISEFEILLNKKKSARNSRVR